MAHEFAHQWFGDMVTCATWADIFLNEGFATWTEAHWTEHNSGYDAYKNEILDNAGYYLSANPGWAISVPSWATNTPDVNTLFNYAITYMKGSCVLYQLRNVMGDSLYFAGLKAYAADTVNFKYKSSTIPDFRDKMEQASGMDLHWFFDEWIFAPNHPSYQNVYAISQLTPNSWQVLFTAKQQQSLGTYWQMPLELKINFSDLTDTIVKVFNSYNNQIFSFPFNKQPVNLVFDPNNLIVLRQGNTTVGTNETAAADTHMLSISPDPFQSGTRLSFKLAEAAMVKLTLFDQLGRKIKELVNGNQIAGEHFIHIEGNNLAPGTYYVHLESAGLTETAKIIRNK